MSDDALALVGNVERLRSAVSSAMLSLPRDPQKTHRHARKMLTVPLRDTAAEHRIVRLIRRFSPGMIEALYFALHRLLYVCDAGGDLGLTPETFLHAWVQTREGRVTRSGRKAVTWADALEDYMALPDTAPFAGTRRSVAPSPHKRKARSMQRAERTLRSWWHTLLHTVRCDPGSTERSARSHRGVPSRGITLRRFVCVVVRTLRESASTRALTDTIDAKAIHACCDHAERYFVDTPRPASPEPMPA